MLEVDQKELLANQVLPFMDRLSMAHSVEVRSPFLDYRIIEFANRLPGRLKIHNGINKYVHKLAVQDLVPEDLRQRPKEGFVQPIYSWMRTSLHGWLESQLDSGVLGKQGIFDPQTVQDLLAATMRAERITAPRFGIFYVSRYGVVRFSSQGTAFPKGCPMILEKEKIRLRPLERSDLEASRQWVNLPGNARDLLRVLPVNQPEQERWFEAISLDPARMVWALL